MSSSMKKEEKIDFDELLTHIGGWGKFQIKLLIIFVQFTFFLAYVGYSPILYLYVPDHWCQIPEQFQVNGTTPEGLIDILIPKDEKTGQRSQCYMYDIEQVDNLESLKNVSNLPQIKCPVGWQYNFTDFFPTASTEFDWVCDDEWKPAFTQSMFYAGAIVGTLVFGWVADTYGRYWSFLVSNFVIMITGIITPFAVGFVNFTIIRFCMGLGFITFFMSIYMLCLEYVSKEKRALVGNLSLAIAMSFGGCIQPWILRAVGDWRIFHHILFCQTAIILIAPWLVKESSRWLITKGRIDEALIIVQQIAKDNGKDVNPAIYQAFKKSAIAEYERNKKVSLNCLDLFKSPMLRKNMVLMILIWSLTSVLFDGNMRNIVNLKFSIYWTFTISAIIELPSDLLAIWGLDLIGRRWSAVLSLFGYFFTMVVTIILFENVLAVTILAMIGRGFITYTMNTAAQISLEVVPTQLRGQGTAIANVAAQIANFFAPQIVLSTVVNPRMPFIILGFGALFTGILSIFISETAGVDLPDTIEDAETLFQSQNNNNGCFCTSNKKEKEIPV